MRVSGKLARTWWMAVALAACTEGGGAGTKDSADDGDDSGGGGGGTTWRAGGEGIAYFLDGAQDNSLLHLELTRVPDPPEGAAYFGFVTRGGQDPLEVGEITVSGEEVYFEGEIGADAIVEGYDGFEAWANTTGTYGDGEQAWVGQVDPVVYEVIQGLVMSSDQTPSGEGSLRAVESLLEDLAIETQLLMDNSPPLADIQAGAEGLANAITGDDRDLDDDGSTEVYGDDLPILLDGSGYVALILADLGDASGQVEPTDPIRTLADYAYDNIQAMESHAKEASESLDVVTAVTSEEQADLRFAEALEHLTFALQGQDLDESGTVDCRVANPTYSEGTIECALVYVSQMAQMSVAVP